MLPHPVIREPQDQTSRTELVRCFIDVVSGDMESEQYEEEDEIVSEDISKPQAAASASAEASGGRSQGEDAKDYVSRELRPKAYGKGIRTLYSFRDHSNYISSFSRR